MQIEFIGCTSAGKSTLVGAAIRACEQLGIEATLGNDCVLMWNRLSWARGYFVRRFFAELFAFFSCLRHWHKHRQFYRFAARMVLRLPASVGWFEKLNTLRTVFRNIGIYEIVRRRGSEQQVVLLDEGTLHTAHYLFFHYSVGLDPNDLSTFVKLVPLPDVVIYLQQEPEILIKRTIRRGHRRIPDRSPTVTERFIRHTMATFERLTQASVINSKMLLVDSRQNIHAPEDYRSDVSLVMALNIIRSAVDFVVADDSKGPVFDQKTS